MKKVHHKINGKLQNFAVVFGGHIELTVKSIWGGENLPPVLQEFLLMENEWTDSYDFLQVLSKFF